MIQIALSDVQKAIVNASEWLVNIVLVAALILGAKKIPGLARPFGRAATEHEKAHNFNGSKIWEQLLALRKNLNQ